MLKIEPMYTSTDVRRMADFTGSYYFSDDTMRWWDSRLLEGFYPVNEERTSGFIVVSNRDRMRGLPREYNAVFVTPNTKESGDAGLDFETVRTCDTAYQAKKFCRESAEFMRYDGNVTL